MEATLTEVEGNNSFQEQVFIILEYILEHKEF